MWVWSLEGEGRGGCRESEVAQRDQDVLAGAAGESRRLPGTVQASLQGCRVEGGRVESGRGEEVEGAGPVHHSGVMKHVISPLGTTGERKTPPRLTARTPRFSEGESSLSRLHLA